MRSLGTETKVGIFVIIGIAVLAYFTVRVGQIRITEKGYLLYAYLESAAGLDKNSPVRIAGVEIGKVESVTLEQAKAKIAMRIPVKVTLPAGSKVYVKSAGLLGEKYVEIIPGTGQGIIPAEGKIEEGGPAVDVDRVLTQLSSIGEDVKAVSQSLSQTLGSKEGQENIKEILSGARQSVDHLQNITGNIERGQGTLGKLVKDDRLYLEVKDTVSNLNKVTESIVKGEGTLGKMVRDDALYREARETVASLNQVARKIERGEGTLGKLAQDDTLYVKTTETMVEAKQTLANLNEMARKIEQGEGTLGKLVHDDTLYVKTTETMVEARETLASLNNVSKQIESGQGSLGKLIKDDSLYEDSKRAIKSINRAAEGIQETTPVTVLGLILGNVLR